MLAPLDLPAGVFRNGTDLQSSGRWRDSSLVRWHEGTTRPVGGWGQRVAGTPDAAPRNAIAWMDNSGDRHLVFATFRDLWHMSEGSVLTQLHPAGVNIGYGGGAYGADTYGTQRATTGAGIGYEDATLNTGFGAGLYGGGYYGTGRTATTYEPATTWSLDTWGEYLIACSNAEGTIFEWQLNLATAPAAVANAPTSNVAAFVTEERFLVALAAGGNKRKVQWSDREANTTWTAAATNEAGDFDLQTPGAIMQGIRARGQSLILTDQDAHTMTYVGPPFVYAFEKVGSACGTISNMAATVIAGIVYWMGPNGFFRYAGGGIEDLPCDVSDYVFDNLTNSQASKVFALPNAKFNEIWWFYPTGIECDRYVVYNYAEGHWAVGTISRTCGVDAGVFNKPLWMDADGAVYEHETGFNYDGAEVYAESGPIQLAEGVFAVTDLIPDEITQGDVTVTFKTRFYPNDTEYEHGPYSMANPTSVRFSGRQMRIRIEKSNPAPWRWGIPRVEVRQMGRR